MMNEPALNCLFANFERFFRRAHLHILQPETKRGERVVGVVIDDVTGGRVGAGRACSRDARVAASAKSSAPAARPCQ